MENRALIGLGAVVVLVFAWLLLAPPRCGEPPPPPPDAAVPDAAVPDAAPPDAAVPDAFAVDDETLTIAELRRIGMLDRPAKHLDALFEGRPNWRRDPSVPAPTWVNQNDVRLSFKVRGGRVISAGAELPETSASADLTALSEFFVGQHDALPFRIEQFERDRPVLTEGAFEDLKGRRFYFRAEMRREGEPPWTPSEFQIATRPFPGQSPALTPPELFEGSDRLGVYERPPEEGTGPLPIWEYPDAPPPGPIPNDPPPEDPATP